MINDVMVFTPVYRLEPETVEAVFNLRWDGPITWVFQRDNPTPLPTSPQGGEGPESDARAIGVKNHLHQYRRGRELFLRTACDALLVIESDIIPPVDALERLAALDVDLAYGAYLFRVTPVVNIFERYQKKAINIGESLTVRGKWPWARQQGVVECSGAGLGCVLIKRHVLEAVDFRITPLGRVHCDSLFTEDVYRKGFSMKADTAVLCGHKREDGEIIWPPS